MNYEMTVEISNHKAKVFMQGGFFKFNSTTKTVHKHKYAEIHIVSGGRMLYSVNGKTFTVNADYAFCVPGETFHSCIETENIIKTDFQTDLDLRRFVLIKLPDGIAQGLINAIKNNNALIKSYVSIICSAFISDKTELVQLSDRAFIIDEFFAKYYNKDVTCGDLSKELFLSTKQTERLVEKFTGNNFRDEITKRRLEAAKWLELETNGKLSLDKIAQNVGYKSYSGFWKARNSSSYNK